ncbi:hypothetical protein [Microseira sp. BLCC-F43]|uniref:hypothetical protein n=1 Tax=Microseira sp. BLCC-F43 TaxID=3153602 RepID=UPI0035B7B5F0
MPIPQETREIPSLLSVEHPTSKGFSQLEFAQIESELICQLFPNPNRISSEHATKAAVETALSQKRSIKLIFRQMSLGYMILL